MSSQVRTTSFEKKNRKKEQSFTSTGDKLLYHKDAVRDLRAQRNHPIVLHIMPTEMCNLKCVFCSVAQRGLEGKLFKDLTMEQIRFVIGKLQPLGLKAVILSGGGDPTLYKQINELLAYLYSVGLEVGMITNGILLAQKVTPENLKRLSWVRISANAFDYVSDIQIPPLGKKTVLGFSYIWNEKSSSRVVKKIISKIEEQRLSNPVTYVRMLPDCNLETAELEKMHQKLRETTRKLGDPFFHQYKTHKTPDECHLGRVHPVLYTDGNIYPCDSLVLNSPPDDKRFHKKYALCRWDQAGEYYRRKIAGSLVNTRNCPCCVFCRQNEILAKLINTKEKRPLPVGKLRHVNFV